MFQTLVSIMQSKGSDWHGLEYWIFDLAEAGTFEERLERLSKMALPPHVHLVIHTPCKGRADLADQHRRITAAGGEGLVIRRPGCLYRPGRCGDIVKIKTGPDLDRWQG